MTASFTTLEKFNAAVHVIQSLPKDGPFQPSNDMKLRFYSHFKQATVGPCKDSKPAFWEVVKRAKWDAWMRLGDLSKEDAMNSYIEDLKKIIETMPYTENAADFSEKLGPFYEIIDIPIASIKEKKRLQWKNNNKIAENGDDDHVSDHHDVKENGLSNGISKNPSVNRQSDRTKIPSRLPNPTFPLGMIDTYSENFYSGTESDDEEFSDPLSADGFEKDETLDVDADDSAHASVVSELNSDVSKGNPSPMLPNGVPHKQKLAYGPIDGVARRGGGDPTAASSSGRMHRNSESSMPSQTGKAYSLGHLELMPAARHSLGMGSGGGQRRGPGGNRAPVDVNEQIAETLFQLQKDMESVLTRLNSLEMLTVAHHNLAQGRIATVLPSEADSSSLPRWWPFRTIPFKAVAIFLAWPVVLHLLINLISAHRARIALRKYRRL